MAHPVVSRRQVVKALAAPSVAVALAACQPGAQPPSPARPAVALTYIYDHTDLPQTIGAWYRWVTDRFAQEFPGSRAELQLVKSVQDLLKVSVAGGKPAADAAYLRLFDARELWDGGVIVELLRCAGDMQSQTVMHRLAQWEPSMTAYYESQAFRDELKKDSLLQVGLDAFKTGKVYPFYRRYTLATGDPYKPIAAAMRGEMDVRAALTEAERLTNQALQG